MFYGSILIFLFFFQAKDVIIKVAQRDPRNIFTQFYIFKISVVEGNSGRGINVSYKLYLSINTKNNHL